MVLLQVILYAMNIAETTKWSTTLDFMKLI